MEEILQQAAEAMKEWTKEKWRRKGQVMGERDRAQVEVWTKDMCALRMKILGMTLEGRLENWKQIMSIKAVMWKEKWEECMRLYEKRAEELRKWQQWEAEKSQKRQRAKGQAAVGQARRWEETKQQGIWEEAERIEVIRMSKWKSWDRRKGQRRRAIKEDWKERDSRELLLWGSMKAMLNEEWDWWVAERVRTWAAEGRVPGLMLRLDEYNQQGANDEDGGTQDLWRILQAEERRTKDRIRRGIQRPKWERQQGDEKIREVLERVEEQVKARRVEQGDRNTLEERGAGAITAAFNSMSEGIKRDREGRQKKYQQTGCRG